MGFSCDSVHILSVYLIILFSVFYAFNHLIFKSISVLFYYIFLLKSYVISNKFKRFLSPIFIFSYLKQKTCFSSSWSKNCVGNQLIINHHNKWDALVLAGMLYFGMDFVSGEVYLVACVPAPNLRRPYVFYKKNSDLSNGVNSGDGVISGFLHLFFFLFL